MSVFVRDIVHDAARAFGTPTRVILGPCRRTQSCLPRFAVAWVASQAGVPAAKIGRVIGRDHKTILPAIKRASALRAENPDFRVISDRLLEARA